MKFDYFRPASLAEALVLLSSYGPQARVVAGGTDLVVKMKGRVLFPARLVDITGIEDLRRIRQDGDGNLVLGPAVTLNELAGHPLIREKCPVLGEAALLVGSPQVRNLATVGGNLCNASPSADLAPALMVLGARLKAASGQASREIALEDFFVGPGQTVLAAGELVTGIEVPASAPSTGAAYQKLSVRRAMDTALVGSAALIRLDRETGTCLTCRIALGAVAPTVVRAHEAEQVLAGNSYAAELVGLAGGRCAEASRPISDLRASAAYRRAMVPVVTRLAVQAAWEKARGVKS